MLFNFQFINDGKVSLSQLSLSPSSGYDHLDLKKDEEEALRAEASEEMECLLSPLGKPDFSDLPSFAYQICDGMVSVHNHKLCLSMHNNVLMKHFWFSLNFINDSNV